MNDLISRQAAIDVLARFLSNREGGNAVWWKPVAESVINVLPSAEPEIIRCKDCKHWYSDADTGMACEFTNLSQPEDGFCNWAERKDGEEG